MPENQIDIKKYANEKSAFGHEIRVDLTPEEIEFFKRKKDVAGMYADDGKIIINPYSSALKTDNQIRGLINLESARGYMSKNKIIPNFKITPEQEKYLTDIGYPKEAWNETLASRIFVGDEIPGGFTPEQEEWVKNNLDKNSTYFDHKTGKLDFNQMNGLNLTNMGLTVKEYATLHDKIANGKASPEEVKQVQQYLVDKGFNIKVDGYAGPKTMDAMNKYVKTKYTADSSSESKEEDESFNSFVNSLPDNLRNTDQSQYNLRGYWESLGKPDAFDYNQPKNEDGTYHAFSRNPKTGEILKSESHPSFNMAILEDSKNGFKAYRNKETGKVYTFENDPGAGYEPYSPKKGATTESSLGNNEDDEYSLSSDKLDKLGESAVNKLKESSEYNAASQKESAAIDKFKRKKEYARQDVANITQAGVDAIKLTQAINQIKQGRKAAAELKGNRPEMPQALPSQPLQKAAQEAEAQAQYGLGDRTKGYMAARDLAAYSNALAAARTAGAGQANLVGSASQGLYNDILNRNLAAGAQDEQARFAKAQYSGELANAQTQEQLANQGRQLQYGYAPKLEEWQIANAEARALTQAGNRNVSNMLSMAPYRAANLAYQYYNSRVQRGNAPVPGSPQWEAEQEAQAKFNQQKAIENLAKRQATENLIKGKINSAGSWIQGQGQNLKNWYNSNFNQSAPNVKDYYDIPNGVQAQNNYYGIPQNYLG